MVGLVILKPDGQVETMNDLAGEMIRHYFPPRLRLSICQILYDAGLLVKLES
jgi:hypothetical protein